MPFASLAAIFVAALPAPVPPQDCGRMELRGRTYQIKADDLRCSTARSHARTYVAQRRAPRGWTCRRYTGRTSLAFRCRRGDRTFFAIKRG